MRTSVNEIFENISGFDSAVDSNVNNSRNKHQEIHDRYNLKRIREVLISATRIEHSDIVLDAGCGTGELTIDALKFSQHVVSVDISFQSLMKAKDNVEEPLSNLILSDITEPCFRDGTFDVILSSEVIEHIPTPLIMLRKLSQLLKPKAMLAITSPNPMMMFFHVSILIWMITHPRTAYRKMNRKENMWFRNWGWDRWIMPWHLDTMIRKIGLQVRTDMSRNMIFIPDNRGLMYRICSKLLDAKAFLMFLRSFERFEKSLLCWAGSRYLRVAEKL